MSALYPKTFAHEWVYDGIDEAVRHGQPVAANVAVDDQIELCLSAVKDKSVVEQNLVQLERQPADAVQYDHDEHHFDYLENHWRKT